MTQIFADPNPKQHSRLTLDDAIAQHKQGLLTAAGLIYHAVKIYRAIGQKLAINVQAFCARLQIARSTFYSAISKLKTLNDGGKLRFAGTSQSQLLLWIPEANEAESESVEATEPPHPPRAIEISSAMPDTPSATSEISSATSEISSAMPDTPSATSEISSAMPETSSAMSETPDNRRPKPTSSKGLANSSNDYQIFIKSLSDDRREKFLNFVVEETKNWKRPINDVHDFLASRNQGGVSRWESYYQNFVAQEQVQCSRPNARDLLAEREAELEAQRQRAQNAYAERMRTQEKTTQDDAP